MIAIKYIGPRPVYIEGTYGSKIIFQQGEVKQVPKELAYKLLKHADVYAEVKDVPATVETVVVKEEEADPEEDNLQHYRDTVANLDKESLETFAQTNFRVKLDGRKSVDKLRSEVIQLIDQYGLS
jgi:hypothetical protein